MTPTGLHTVNMPLHATKLLWDETLKWPLRPWDETKNRHRVKNKYRLFLTINGSIFLQKIATKQNFKKKKKKTLLKIYMNGNVLSMTLRFFIA